MRTSEVATQAAVNVATLRYYERRGLLPEPARSAAGYRAYPPQTAQRVRFIKRAQELGFRLDDVATLLHLAEGGPDGCDQVRELTADRLSDVERRIADLEAMRDSLARLAATCARPRSERDCPLLKELAP